MTTLKQTTFTDVPFRLKHTSLYSVHLPVRWMVIVLGMLNIMIY